MLHATIPFLPFWHKVRKELLDELKRTKYLFYDGNYSRVKWDDNSEKWGKEIPLHKECQVGAMHRAGILKVNVFNEIELNQKEPKYTVPTKIQSMFTGKVTIVKIVDVGEDKLRVISGVNEITLKTSMFESQYAIITPE